MTNSSSDVDASAVLVTVMSQATVAPGRNGPWSPDFVILGTANSCFTVAVVQIGPDESAVAVWSR